MSESRNGDREIRGALAESRRLFVSVGLFSVFVNLLMLTGPLFMLPVYDRVLASRSEATLVTLIGIVAFLFLMMGVLDHARGRVLARAGARLQARLESRVLRAILTRAIAPAERSRPATGVRDLEAIQRFFAGSGPFAFFDAPWTPVFLCALFMFHWSTRRGRRGCSRRSPTRTTAPRTSSSRCGPAARPCTASACRMR